MIVFPRPAKRDRKLEEEAFQGFRLPRSRRDQIEKILGESWSVT
jgi:hypothetical protein